MLNGSRPSVSTSTSSTRCSSINDASSTARSRSHANPETLLALTHSRSKRLGHGPQAHDEDVGARYRLTEALKFGTRLDDPRDDEPASARRLVVRPERGKVRET